MGGETEQQQVRNKFPAMPQGFEKPITLSPMSVHASTIQKIWQNRKAGLASMVVNQVHAQQQKLSGRIENHSCVVYLSATENQNSTTVGVCTVLPPTDVYRNIKDLLGSHAITYREVTHEPTRTSEQSAKARGEDLSIGGKAILLKVGETFRLFVLSAAKKLDSQKIKEHFGEKRLRFATPKELQEMTGLVPGSVPPFGRPVTTFELCLDSAVTKNSKIAFNAGLLTTSIIMDMSDYLHVASPEIFDFSD